MKRIVFLFFLVFLFYTNAYAMDMEGCGSHKCTDCHKLTLKEAEELFKGRVDKVNKVTMSPVRGLWQVEIESGGRRGNVYVDFSKNYVITGRILRISNIPLNTKRQGKLKIDFSKIPLNDAIVIGNSNAEHKVVIYDDPECPYCARLHEEVKKIVNRRNDIVF
ncbi:MAG: DsbC family protein, partial [Nitrospirae bacterium]